MLRIDHVAWRSPDRKKTAKFLTEAFGYRLQQEFTIDFGDGDTAECIALEPGDSKPNLPFIINHIGFEGEVEMHRPAEFFVSDGSANSIVGKWVAERGGMAAIHHVAFLTEDVAKSMKEWQEKGLAEFTSEPVVCNELIQVFSKPISEIGIVIELIQRKEVGFCRDSVKTLMEKSVEKK